MSRCFPYPPPGYEKSSPLIESIKLRNEKEKAKKERQKEKKREKREKSSGDDGKKEEKRHSHKKRKYEELDLANQKAGDYIKIREDESAQLEKSSVTEELGPPAVHNLCDSSDSTQNSSKRKRHEAAEVEHGNGLRIRLPLLRHRDSEQPSSSVQPCFSGRIEAVPAQQEIRSTGHEKLSSPSEQPCFSGRINATPPEEIAKISHSKTDSVVSSRSHSSRCCCDSNVRRQYKNLIENWIPPPLETENPEFDDQDWLFGKTARRHDGEGETSRRQVASEDLDLGSALCSWPPRAIYLPEAEIYALPYVVPF
uniref:Uncharacterized protein n=1 Tax=Anthurium amnicola TaxID=1678845 RepID=A0A1D1YI48_9ARAE